MYLHLHPRTKFQTSLSKIISIGKSLRELKNRFSSFHRRGPYFKHTMGNCLYKVLSLGNPPRVDLDDAWKRQTRGTAENHLYAFVDLKGPESKATLVEIYRNTGRSGLLRALRKDKILLPYLYGNGGGKELTSEELQRWRETEVKSN